MSIWFFQAKLLSVLVLSVRAQFDSTKCQNRETPESCVCVTHPWGGLEIDMTCTGLEDSGSVLRGLKYNPNVVRFHLVNSHLPYLPLGLSPHRLTHLYITNSSVQHLSPPMSDLSAFDGLTNLTSLTIKGVSDLNNWDWSKLKPLVNLQSIHIEDSHLPELPSTFSTLGEKYYWKLNITSSQLLHIQPLALSSKSLESFASRGNPLRTLRADIHGSNSRVNSLELTDTKIPLLDNDFLRRMQALRSFVTDSHFLSYMSSSPFYSRLNFFAILGRSPPCHCKYQYLLSNGLRWKEHCILTTSTSTTEYIMAEYLSVAC